MEVVENLRPRDGEQGTDITAPPGRYAAKAAQSTAAQKMLQDSFRIVVGAVGGGKALAVQPVKKGVALGAGGGFYGLSRRIGAGLGGAHRQRNAMGGAKRPDKGLVPVGFFTAKPVIEMGGADRDGKLRRQGSQAP